MYLKKIVVALVLVLVLLFPQRNALSQQQEKLFEVKEIEVSSCEYNQAIISAFAEQLNDKDNVIVIAKPARKEKSNKYSFRRLHNVRVFLTKIANVFA